MSEGLGARRLARFVATLSAVGAVLAPIARASVWVWLAISRPVADAPTGGEPSQIAVEVASGSNVSADQIGDIATAAFIAGGVIAALAAAPVVVALWSVRRTLLECAAGRTFSPRSVRSFRRFAWASLIAVPATNLAQSLSGVAVTTLSPKIENALSFGLSSDEIVRVFSALLLVAVAHMFAEGRRMAEDVEGLL